MALLKECIAGLKRQTVPLAESHRRQQRQFGRYGCLARHPGRPHRSLPRETWADQAVSTPVSAGPWKENPDWVWLMDDDAEPYPDALEKLIPFLDTNSVAAAATSVIDKEDKLQLVHRGQYDYRRLTKEYGCRPTPESEYTKSSVDVGYATFVGIIVNAKAIKVVGLPKKELFSPFRRYRVLSASKQIRPDRAHSRQQNAP